MKKSCLSLALLWLFISAFSATKVELQSDKTATAEVTENKAEQLFTVSLKFLPVTTLDPVTNDEMSDVLAEFFAEEAISTYLKKPKAIVFSKSKKSIQGKTNKEYYVIYSVPSSSIVDVEENIESPNAETLKSAFLSETASLLQDFRSTCFHDLRVTEAVFFEQIEKAKDKTALSKRIADAFSAFEKKVEKDDELFLSEKKELTQKAEFIKKHLQDKLSKRIENETKDSEPVNEMKDKTIDSNVFFSSVSQATIIPEYKSFFLENPILLETEGCSAFQVPDGSVYIITVGRSAANNNSVDERILQEKIAETKAYGELSKFNGSRISFFAQQTRTMTTNKTQVEQYEKKKTKSITIRANSYIKSMQTIGTWYSSDGASFYLAKGMKLKPGEWE